MSFWRPPARRNLSDAAKANIARVQEIWTNARAKYGAAGPFLFGRFSAADAMYAPVVARLNTYGIEVGGESLAYMEGMKVRSASSRARCAPPREASASG